MSAGNERCRNACKELKGLCAQSRAICKIAKKAMDRDALARCDRADRRCRAEAGRQSRTCECRAVRNEPGEALQAVTDGESRTGATYE